MISRELLTEQAKRQRNKQTETLPDQLRKPWCNTATPTPTEVKQEAQQTGGKGAEGALDM